WYIVKERRFSPLGNSEAGCVFYAFRGQRQDPFGSFFCKRFALLARVTAAYASVTTAANYKDHRRPCKIFFQFIVQLLFF
ncbi:hypothetical protein J6J34_12085, partial [Pseudidiomarina sp. 1ASP75-14]|uniref:hypothetical protein n=1 Tax=Pseudidiomarina terrestris TaxID=2820060 RepID=UPI00264FE48D